MALLVLFTLISVALGWALWRWPDGAAEQLVGVAGLFVSLGALAVSVVALLPTPPPRAAEELANDLARTVAEQWEEEVTARRLRDPRVIPLSWSATRRPVAASPEAVIGSVDARVLRLSLEGRLAGDFDTAARRLAAGFARVPSRRLVVLGEPGAGKTVLAAMLTLGLLAAREPAAPVPVLLSVSTWDPVTEPLGVWIVRSLATSYYGGRPDLPRRLLERRLLLPVLDGLDEMPEVARRGAVRAINDACGDGQGVVVTCRIAEYEDVIEGGSPVLRRAPVVEVSPVEVPDVLACLREVDWPQGVDWEPVYTHLEANPEGPLATALSTPLALSLARTIYRTAERSPAELLDYDSRHAIEDHLVDQLIPAAYAPAPAPGQQADDGWRQQAERAERYLTYLAAHLHHHRERDLAWWLMSSRILSRWAGIVLGIVVGLITMLVVATTVKLVNPDTDSLKATTYIGIAVAVLTTLAWYGPPDRAPGRLSFSVRGSLGRLRRWAFTGFRLAALLLLPVMFIVAIVISLGDGWSQTNIIQYCTLLALEAAAAGTLSIAFGVHGWLDAPPEQSAGSSPGGLLRRDRASSLVGAAAAGAVLAAVLLPLLCVADYAAYVAFLMLTRGVRTSVPPGTWASVVSNSGIHEGPLIVCALTVLPGTVFAVLVLLTRAWTRFAVLRLVLAARGVLPWRLHGFLRDARKRQLLRQSAGTYQFRHVRLQERLAARPRPRTPAAPVRTARRRRVLAVAAALVLVLSVRTLDSGLPQDRSDVVMAPGDFDAMGLAPAPWHTLITLNVDSDSDRITVKWWDTRTAEKIQERRVPFPGSGDDDLLDPGSDSQYPSPNAVLASARSGLWYVRTRDTVRHSPSALVVPWDGGRPTESTLFSETRPDANGNDPGSLWALSPGATHALSPAVLTNVRETVMAVRSTGTGKPDGGYIVEPTKYPPPSLAVSDKGDRVAALSDYVLSVYDTRTHGRTCKYTLPGERNAYGRPLLAMDGTGTWLAAALGRKVDVVRYRAGKCFTVTSFTAGIGGPDEGVTDIVMNEDGSQLATSSGNTVRVWDLHALEN